MVYKHIHDRQTILLHSVYSLPSLLVAGTLGEDIGGIRRDRSLLSSLSWLMLRDVSSVTYDSNYR